MSRNRASVVKKCIELMNKFNPVTHSIDTFCIEELGGVNEKDSNPDNLFIQQILYGCQRERSGLDCFINNFFGDNSARVLRTDRHLYAIFAYIAMFRLEELGFTSFKTYILSQDAMKMFFFMSYLFNTDNLWSCLRADWIKVYDLGFVEDEIIAGIERFLPEANSFIPDLQHKAEGAAAARAAKEKARRDGTLGVAQVAKKEPTRPQSPAISKPKPPKIPEPTRIDQKVVVKDIPSYLEKTSLEVIQQKRTEQKEATRLQTLAKYSEKDAFQFQERRSGRDLEEVRQEVEQRTSNELDFNRSFYNPPPDFKNTPAKIRLNVAAILREDALYKKQQAKDAQVLKAYEEDLRDSSEYYSWLTEMKQRDEQIKLKNVALRRELAKQSKAQAREAIERQRDDNAAVAALMREQADSLRQQRILEEEIRNLEAQQLAQQVSEVRDKAPKVARERLLQEREEQSNRLREELELCRRLKEEQDEREAEERADKIRQLKAENSVLKKHVVVFDPTESSGIGLLDEMSYLEMKERLEGGRRNQEETVALKRQEILDEKGKKALDLEQRAQNIQRARQAKAAANKAAHERRAAQIAKESIAETAKKEAAAVALDEELNSRREERRREAEALKAEADRVRRQQQYLGVAKGQVDDVRSQQQLSGQERKFMEAQTKSKIDAEFKERASAQDLTNKFVAKKRELLSKAAEASQREKDILEEKKEALAKVKKSVLDKKSMVARGRDQAAATKHAIIESNPYAHKISEESLRAVRSRSS